jgi:hypothetical protein
MSASALALAISVLAALGYLAIAATASIVTALRAGGRREDGPDEHDPLAASRLTMPVSIVVPAGDSPRLSQAIADLSDLSYPEFEVIVVADQGATDLKPIMAAWELESREFFYRRALETKAVVRILRSARDPRLVVVEKEPGRRSDAVNCGVNFARYRYVAVVPPHVSFARTALLSAMKPALRDPATIVGVGSPIERIPDPLTVDRRGRFERLRSLRALMFTRLFWAKLRRGLGSEDGVTIWRRDAVLQANGFSRDAADPDLEMMFRLQRSGQDERRFVRNEDAFGHAATVCDKVARRTAARRQRTALKAIATWGPAAAESVGLEAFTYFLQAELLVPLAQLWLIAGTLAGAALGWFSWTAPAAALLLLSFGTAAVSAAALLVRGAQADPPESAEVRALVRLSPFEFLTHRPRRVWSRVSALCVAPAEPGVLPRS